MDKFSRKYPESYLLLLNKFEELAAKGLVVQAQQATLGNKKSYWTYLNEVKVFTPELLNFDNSGALNEIINMPNNLGVFIDKVCKGDLDKAILVFRGFYRQLNECYESLVSQYELLNSDSFEFASEAEITGCKNAIDSSLRRHEHNKLVHDLLQDIKKILNCAKRRPERYSDKDDQYYPHSSSQEHKTIYHPVNENAFIFKNFETSAEAYHTQQPNQDPNFSVTNYGMCRLCHRPIITTDDNLLKNHERNEIQKTKNSTTYTKNGYCFYHRIAGKEVRRNDQNMINRAFDYLLSNKQLLPHTEKLFTKNMKKEETFQKKWALTSGWANKYQSNFTSEISNIAIKHFNFKQEADWSGIKDPAKMVTEAIAICSVHEHTKEFFKGFPINFESNSQLIEQLAEDVFFPELKAQTENKKQYLDYYCQLLSPCEFICMLMEMGKYSLIKIAGKKNGLAKLMSPATT